MLLNLRGRDHALTPAGARERRTHSMGALGAHMPLERLARYDLSTLSRARNLRRKDVFARLEVPQDGIARNQLPAATEAREWSPRAIRAHGHVRFDGIVEDILSASARTTEAFIRPVVAFLLLMRLVSARRHVIAAARAGELRPRPERAELREVPRHVRRRHLPAAAARAQNLVIRSVIMLASFQMRRNRI